MEKDAKKKGGSLRLFLAIPFTAAVRNELKKVMAGMRRQGASGCFTKEENLHLTLVFFGETTRAEEIADALRAVPLPVIRLAFDRIGRFGSLYWIGLRDNPALDDYVGDLRRALEKRAVPFDRKAFKPHVTLLRRGHVRRPLRLAVPTCSMPVNEVLLMRSDRVDGGMRYTAVAAQRRKRR